ncbi:MAG: hypothetical protein D6728_17175 [Cyanobacteria bacterium J055]|nr:MAG: hypothetical protein D6728_17175 [Cyanobacteria bacterium J055]
MQNWRWAIAKNEIMGILSYFLLHKFTFSADREPPYPPTREIPNNPLSSEPLVTTCGKPLENCGKPCPSLWKPCGIFGESFGK